MDAAALADLLARVGPVLAFLLAITVVADIADRAGVFDVAAHWASHGGRHRVPVLWLLFAALAWACTVVLSLDTTAVLLTPIGLAVAKQVGASPIPFALTTLWLANTGSLMLPVSNLTNLLALHHFHLLGVGHSGFVRLALWPAVTAVLATLVVLAVLYREDLRGRYELDPPPDPHDRVLLWVSGLVCVAVAVLFAVGAQPAIVSAAAAVLLVAVATWRDRSALRAISVPWVMALAVAVLFVVVDVAVRHGLRAPLQSLVGTGSGPADLAQATAAGLVSANAINNLPAYLALEPVASDDARRLLAMLIGVNAGPLVTPWASLATLLWAQRCRAAGVQLRASTLAWQGGLVAVAACTAAWAALAYL